MVAQIPIEESWLSYANDAQDPAIDRCFEEDLTRLLQPGVLDEQQQWRLAADLERCILSCDVQPSERQRARFWHFRTHQYVRLGHSMQAFEAITLCERSVPRDDTVARLSVHALLVHLALQQGYYTQSLMSSNIVITSIQELAPRFVAAQYQNACFAQRADDTPHLTSGDPDMIG